MFPPRLPAKIEHRVVKRACGLSPRVIRRLIGPPPRLDGQELAPDIQMFLALAKLNGETSLVGARPVERAGAKTRAGAPVVGGPPRPMARVDELTIPGPGSAMPARLYVALGAPQPPQPLLVY